MTLEVDSACDAGTTLNVAIRNGYRHFCRREIERKADTLETHC